MTHGFDGWGPKYCMALALISVFFSFDSQGQGTLLFANSGEEVHAPISGPDGLLGEGHFAQLHLADGTNIGDPAPFLAEGLFSDGLRVIPGVATGQSLNLQISFLDADGAWIGTTDFFRVTLGDSENPGMMTQLRPYTLPSNEPVYAWMRPAPLLGFTDTICRLVGMGNIEFTAIVPVDDCFCAGLRAPGAPDRVPLPCDEEDGTEDSSGANLTYNVSPSGELELRWPIAKTLIRSTEVDSPGETVTAPSSEPIDGEHVMTFSTNEAQLFFWLE